MSRIGENHLRNQQNAVEKLQESQGITTRKLVSTTANLKTNKTKDN